MGQHHRALSRAGSSHQTALGRRHALTFIGGNHDAGVVSRGSRERLLALCELGPDAPLSIEPWFIRRGAVHIEHGHVYDPDNAPAHPLALWSPETEPLGISLTRRFLSPHDAFTFAHAHHTTPLQGLMHAFKSFRFRAPLMVGHYFATASRLAAEAAVPERLGAEKARGASAVAAFVRQSGVPEGAVVALLEALPRPTPRRLQEHLFPALLRPCAGDAEHRRRRHTRPARRRHGRRGRWGHGAFGRALPAPLRGPRGRIATRACRWRGCTRAPSWCGRSPLRAS